MLEAFDVFAATSHTNHFRARLTLVPPAPGQPINPEICSGERGGEGVFQLTGQGYGIRIILVNYKVQIGAFVVGVPAYVHAGPYSIRCGGAVRDGEVAIGISGGGLAWGGQRSIGDCTQQTDHGTKCIEHTHGFASCRQRFWLGVRGV